MGSEILNVCGLFDLRESAGVVVDPVKRLGRPGDLTSEGKKKKGAGGSGDELGPVLKGPGQKVNLNIWQN